MSCDLCGWFLCLSSGEKFKAVLLRMSQLASSGATELRVRSLDAISQILTLQVCVRKQKEYFFAIHLFVEKKCNANNVLLQPEQQTEDLLALTESWFHLLSKHPMDMICNISTQPFPELHCGALGIFTVSAQLFLTTIMSSLCHWAFDNRWQQPVIIVSSSVCVFQAIATQPWGQKLMISTPSFMEFVLDRSTGQTKEAKDAKFELVGALVCSSTTAEILGSQHYIRLKTYLREGPYYVSAVASVSTEGAEWFKHLHYASWVFS